MDEKAQAIAEQIGQIASQLQELAVQADLPFLAHLLRLVMMEAERSASLQVIYELVTQAQ